MLLSTIAFLMTATCAVALPAISIGQLEDIPWQIRNLSVHTMPANTTRLNETQHIVFNAVDVNDGLEFDTICRAEKAAGQPIFANGYTKCGFESAGFSLRSDGSLWFHRTYTNTEPFPFNKTTCNGMVDLKQEADYFDNGPHGMTVINDYLEIKCTNQSGK